MKQSLSDFVIALLDLAEAEGRTLRSAVIQVGWSVALIAIAAASALLGVSCLLWAVHLWLEPHLGAAGAAVVISILFLLVAAMTTLMARSRD